MKKLRVGIIGTGFGASVHAPILKLHEGFEVVALASVHRELKQEDVSHLRIGKLYQDWRQMLEAEQLDLVSVASIPALHKEMALAAIDRRMNVWCEKPLGMHARETLEMLAAEKKNERRGFVHFQWRLTPVRRKVRELLALQVLGQIQHVKFQGSFSGYALLTTSRRGWEGQQKAGGGMLNAVGSHMLDSLMWWLDARITEVNAQLKLAVPSFEDANGMEQRDAEDSFTINGTLEGGTTFSMDFFQAAVRGTGWEVEIYGTKGTLRVRQDAELELSYGGAYEKVELEQVHPPQSLSSPASLYYSGVCPMIEGIYQSLMYGSEDKDLPTFSDGHRVQCVLDAIRRSSAERSMANVAYV